MSYYGWVPTIIGRLTFAFVGSTIARRNGRQWGGPLIKLFDNAHGIVFFQDLRTGDAALLFPFADERQVNRIVVVGKRVAGEASSEPFQGRMFVICASA